MHTCLFFANFSSKRNDIFSQGVPNKYKGLDYTKPGSFCNSGQKFYVSELCLDPDDCSSMNLYKNIV